MSTVDDIEQIYTASVPQDVTASDLGKIIRRAIAEALGVVSTEADGYVDGSRLRTAVGGYLDLHAMDRGLRRQDGETDDQLRERLRKPPAAVTISAIRDAVNAIIGDAGPVIIVELPRSSLYLDRAGEPPYLPETQYAMCLDRGRRCGGGRGVVIALIPSSANAVQSVSDALRSKVAAGKLWLVQEYYSAATAPRSRIYYPPTPSIMQVALTPTIDDANWSNGYLFEEEDGATEFQSSPKFGSPEDKILFADLAPGLTRVEGLRNGSRAIVLPDNTTQVVASSTGMDPGAGGFKLAFVARFSEGSYNLRSVLGYGSVSDAGFFLIHSGTASSDPPPNSLRFIVYDGSDAGVVDLENIPNDEWLVIYLGYDKSNGTVDIAYAGASGSDSASADASAVVGNITSTLSDSLKIGSVFGTSAQIPIDAMWYSVGGETVSANVETAAQNLFNFIARP